MPKFTELSSINGSTLKIIRNRFRNYWVNIPLTYTSQTTLIPVFLGLFFLGMTFPASAQFEGQIVQVCDGSGGTTTIFATAQSAPSGNWELGVFNGTSLASASNDEYIEVTNVARGTALEIRDTSTPSTKAQLINTGSTFYTTSNAADGSCSEQLSCSIQSLYDIGGNGFAGQFSNSNSTGIIGSNSLDGPHAINFNAVIFGNFNTDGTGDTEGRLAVQNDFTSTSGSGYTVGGGAPTSTGGLNAPFGWDNLVVGGDLDFDGGGVRGNILYNTATNLPGFIGLAASGMYRQENPDIDWNGSHSELKTLSTDINPLNISVPHTTGLVSGTSTLTLDGQNNTGLVVFNISSFNSGGSFNFINVSNADALLINIGGTTVSFSEGSILLEGTILNFPFNSGSSGKELIEKTIWNFYETTTFSLDGYLLTGSVLAPFTSSVTLSGGNINGQSVFSGTVQQSNGFEFHNFCFQGSDYLPETFTLTIGPCWRTLSSPIAGLKYNELLDDLWTQGASGADITAGDPNIYLMNSTGDDWTPLGDLNQVISPGTGFLMSVFTDDEYGISGSWDKTISAGGTEHAAPVTVETPEMSGADNGFSILGNPYKTPISFDALSLNDVESTVWIYDRNGNGTTNGSQGNWISWSGGVGDIKDGIIDPFQGFVVRNVSSPSDPSVTFPESSKTTGGEFYGKNQSLSYLRLEIQGETLYNSMWIRFSPEGSFQETVGDAIQLMPFESSYAILSTQKNSGNLMDIGHYPLPASVDDYSIPVLATVSRGGKYSIIVTDINLPADTNLYIQDMEKGISRKIDENFEYTFSVADKQYDNDKNNISSCKKSPQQAKKNTSTRFLITTNPGNYPNQIPNTFSLSQNYPNPFNPTTIIHYELPQTSDVKLTVFDMLGRHVATLVDDRVEAGSHTVRFDAGNLSSGVYLYRLNAQNRIISKKLTVIK